jgi:hypothetical protein
MQKNSIDIRGEQFRVVTKATIAKLPDGTVEATQVIVTSRTAKIEGVGLHGEWATVRSVMDAIEDKLIREYERPEK